MNGFTPTRAQQEAALRLHLRLAEVYRKVGKIEHAKAAERHAARLSAILAGGAK